MIFDRNSASLECRQFGVEVFLGIVRRHLIRQRICKVIQRAFGLVADPFAGVSAELVQHRVFRIRNVTVSDFRPKRLNGGNACGQLDQIRVFRKSLAERGVVAHVLEAVEDVGEGSAKLPGIDECRQLPVAARRHALELLDGELCSHVHSPLFSKARSCARSVI